MPGGEVQVVLLKRYHFEMKVAHEMSEHSSQWEGIAATSPVRNELTSSAQNRDFVVSAVHVSDKNPKYVFSFKC
jgi:hypothetical protein